MLPLLLYFTYLLRATMAILATLFGYVQVKELLTLKLVLKTCFPWPLGPRAGVGDGGV